MSEIPLIGNVKLNSTNKCSVLENKLYLVKKKQKKHLNSPDMNESQSENPTSPNISFRKSCTSQNCGLL